MKQKTSGYLRLEALIKEGVITDADVASYRARQMVLHRHKVSPKPKSYYKRISPYGKKKIQGRK